MSVSTLAASTKGSDTFKQPSGVAVSRTGVVYVADSGKHAIVAISEAGAVTLKIGTGKPGMVDGAAAQAAFKSPTGIALDEAAGVLYVADRANHAIHRVTLDGEVTTIAGTGKSGDRDGPGRDASFKSPAGLALGDDGTLYIADSGNHTIRALLPDGNVVTIAGSGSPTASRPASKAIPRRCSSSTGTAPA
ncbi:MAG: NHL domain-containing protein [Thermoanaerobaculia bacterium]